MKKNLTLFVSLTFLVLAVFASGEALAQRSRKLSSTPKAFQAFYAKFTRAVARTDKTAVAALTRFPFQYGWDAGDEGTYTKTQFTKKFNDIFGGTTKLFAQKNPTFYFEGASYSLMNEDDASHYIFKKIGANYRFTAIIVEP